MITGIQAYNLCEYLISLGKDAELVLDESIKRGHSPNIVCLSHLELSKLDIAEKDLHQHLGSFYDGYDTHYGFEPPEQVHVINLHALSEYTRSTLSWEQKQELREQAENNLEVGG